jgi:hypothetical protein
LRDENFELHISANVMGEQNLMYGHVRFALKWSARNADICDWAQCFDYIRDLRPAKWGSTLKLHSSNLEPLMSALPPKADID